MYARSPARHHRCEKYNSRSSCVWRPWHTLQAPNKTSSDAGGKRAQQETSSLAHRKSNACGIWCRCTAPRATCPASALAQTTSASLSTGIYRGEEHMGLAASRPQHLPNRQHWGRALPLHPLGIPSSPWPLEQQPGPGALPVSCGPEGLPLSAPRSSLQPLLEAPGSCYSIQCQPLCSHIRTSPSFLIINSGRAPVPL